jgi:hypothetical protein
MNNNSQVIHNHNVMLYVNKAPGRPLRGQFFWGNEEGGLSPPSLSFSYCINRGHAPLGNRLIVHTDQSNADKA